MNVLSLFDGISCGRVALDRAGFQVGNYFASEVDKKPILISQSNYPDIIQLGDVTKIDLSLIKSLPKIDLVLAGSPCQGFSRAGKGLNFEDPRSKLFFNFVEILSAIREYNNPHVNFLLENVKMKNEYRDIITDFVKQEPIEINSKLVAAQNRPRIYWTDIPHVQQPKDRGIKLADILEDVELEDYKQKGVIKICNSFSPASQDLVMVNRREVRIKQAVHAGYIVAHEGDGLNLSFPGSRSRRGRVIAQKSSTLDCACNIGVLHNNQIRRFTISELEKLQTLPVGYTEGVSDSARKKALGNGWTVDVIAHLLQGLQTKKEGLIA